MAPLLPPAGSLRPLGADWRGCPTGLQGTWGRKGGAGGITRVVQDSAWAGRAAGRGPCSGEMPARQALSWRWGLMKPSEMSGQAQLRDDASPPTLRPQSISEAAWQELVVGSFLDVPRCVCVQAGRGRVDGRRTWAGGQDGHSPAVGHPARWDPCASHPHLPRGPSVPGTPKHHTCCQAGHSKITAVTRGLQPFIYEGSKHRSPARRHAAQAGGPAADWEPPVQRPGGGPSGRGGVGWRCCPEARGPAGPHLQAGRPWPDPPSLSSDRVGVFCEQPRTPCVPEPGSPPPGEKKQSGRKQPFSGPRGWSGGWRGYVAPASRP